MRVKRGTTFLRTFILVAMAVLLIAIGMGSAVISSAEGALSAPELPSNNAAQLVQPQEGDAGIMPMAAVPQSQATPLTAAEVAAVQQYWDFEQMGICASTVY